VTVIQVFGKQRQEDHKFKATQGYVAKPCSQKKKAGCGGSHLYFQLFKRHFEISLGKSAKPYKENTKQKQKQKAKKLGEWNKWKSTCLVCLRP
jgi:hypothetical protein